MCTTAPDVAQRPDRTASALSPWAHLATVGADGESHVVPEHPCREGDVLWIMCGTDLVTARDVAHGGPDHPPGTAFMAITPTRALLLRRYGMGGSERWTA
jgi:hypothetical protein